MDGITESMDMNLGKLREMVRDREAWGTAVHVLGSQRVRHCLAAEQQQQEDLNCTRGLHYISLGQQHRRRCVFRHLVYREASRCEGLQSPAEEEQV